MPATYEPIASTTLASPATSISLTSIPATYTDLRVVFYFKYETTASATSVRFNSDSGANYGYTYLYTPGSSLGTSTSGSGSRILLDAVSAASTTYFSLWEADIFNYTSSANKSILDKYNKNVNTNDGTSVLSRHARVWTNSAAITSIAFARFDGNSFATGTKATVWGILKA